MNTLYAIHSPSHHVCSQPKIAKIVHKLKYRHFWSRIEMGSDASISNKSLKVKGKSL